MGDVIEDVIDTQTKGEEYVLLIFRFVKHHYKFFLGFFLGLVLAVIL